MDEQLEIKQLERKILDNEVSIMLIKLCQEAIEGSLQGKTVDTDKWARKVVAHCQGTDSMSEWTFHDSYKTQEAC